MASPMQCYEGSILTVNKNNDVARFLVTCGSKIVFVGDERDVAFRAYHLRGYFHNALLDEVQSRLRSVLRVVLRVLVASEEASALLKRGHDSAGNQETFNVFLILLIGYRLHWLPLVGQQ